MKLSNLFFWKKKRIRDGGWKVGGKHIQCCHNCKDKMLSLTKKGAERLSRRQKKKPHRCIFCGVQIRLYQMKQEVINYL